MAKKRAKVSKARPLVGGFLERISVTAFEKYHREITDLVQTQHGVYRTRELLWAPGNSENPGPGELSKRRPQGGVSPPSNDRASSARQRMAESKDTLASRISPSIRLSAAVDSSALPSL